MDRNDPDGLERAREDFLVRVAAFRGDRDIDITVVFDGSDNPAPVVGSNPGGIKVVFSKPPQNADRLIVAKIESASAPGSITVVSSDNFVRSSAAALGCKSMTVEEFQQQFRKRSSGRIDDKYAGEISQADLEQWLEIFSQKEKENDQ